METDKQKGNVSKNYFVLGCTCTHNAKKKSVLMDLERSSQAKTNPTWRARTALAISVHNRLGTDAGGSTSEANPANQHRSAAIIWAERLRALSRVMASSQDLADSLGHRPMDLQVLSVNMDSSGEAAENCE